MTGLNSYSWPDWHDLLSGPVSLTNLTAYDRTYWPALLYFLNRSGLRNMKIVGDTLLKMYHKSGGIDFEMGHRNMKNVGDTLIKILLFPIILSLKLCLVFGFMYTWSFLNYVLYSQLCSYVSST